MAPLLGPPPASGVTQRFSEWNAERDAIKSQFESDEERENSLFNEAKKALEASIDQEKQAVVGSHAVHPSVLQFFEDKRVSQVKKLQHVYETKKAERKQSLEQRLLEHIEACSAFLGLAGAATRETAKNVKQVERVKPAKQAKQATQVPSQASSQQTSSPPLAVNSRPLTSTENTEVEAEAEAAAGKDVSVAAESHSIAVGSSQTTAASHDSKLIPTVDDPTENLEDVQKKAQTRNKAADEDASAKAVSQDPRTLDHQLQPQQSDTTAKSGDGLPRPRMVLLSNGANDAIPAPASTKRKADSQPPSPRTSLKKSKLDAGASESTKDGHGEQSQKKPATKRSISFDEVYQDGNAEYKHMIIEYPAGENNWYILRCDEHGVHFNLNPLHGAAKHLHSSQHGHQSKEHSLAIATLGHLVFDCDIEMAKRNNAATSKAFAAGYKPFNRNNLSKSKRESMGLAVPETPPRIRKRPAKEVTNAPADTSTPLRLLAPATVAKSFPGITNPVPGELYRGYWSQNKTKYAVMVLPWGDLSVAGMHGTLATTGLLVKAPRCHLTDRMTQEIRGWAAGYEDGGPLVTKREFPVMYFDGARSVGWLRAKDLSSFDMEDPESALIPNFDVARNYYARAHGFDDYAAMKKRRWELGFSEKRLSDVGQPSPESLLVVPAVSADVSSKTPADTAGEAQHNKHSGVNTGEKPSVVFNQKKSTGSIADDNDKANADVEMRDVPLRDDETESYQGSEPKDWTDNDEHDDVEMANSESRRTSVSANAGPREATGGTTTKSPAAVDIRGVKDKTMKSSSSLNPTTDTNPAHPGTPLSSAATVRTGIEMPNGHNVDPYPQSMAKGPAQPPAPVNLSAGEPNTLRRDLYPTEAPNDLRDMTNAEPVRTGSYPLTNGASMASQQGAQHISTQSQQPPARATSADVSRNSPFVSQPRESSVARSEGMPPRQTIQNILQSNDEANPAGVFPGSTAKISPVVGPSALARSSSSTPAPISKPNSRASTPSIIRTDDAAQMNRWRAVRSEPLPPPRPDQSRISGSSSPSSTGPAIPSARTSSSEPPNKGIPLAQGNRGVSPLNPSADGDGPYASIRFKSPIVGASKVELFELAVYEDVEGGYFSSRSNGAYLQLPVNVLTKTAEAVIDRGLRIKIDPTNIYRVVVEPLGHDRDAACRVTLTMKDSIKGPREQKLVFERTKAMGRDESGRIHARRFCRWTTSVNAGIDYRNKSFDQVSLPPDGSSA